MENQNIDSKPAVEANEPNRYAVLVGCNYPNTKKELQGCVNDVTRMQKTLLERFGFNQDNIHMLIDTDPASTKPTADNIKEALQSMVNKASPGDVLLFYFSGHGNHVARPDDETGFDECIVACDMVFIPDDYFRALVNQLPEGTSFTIISDSCLSGGLIDKEKEQIGPHHQPGAAAAKPSVETQPRLIKPEEVTDGLPDAKPGPKDKVHPDMGILLSGCQPDEASHDCPSDDDPSKSGGAFSNALQRALERHPGAISNRYLILETRRILMHQHIKQHPCLYCSDANAVATFLRQPKLKPISSSSTE